MFIDIAEGKGFSERYALEPRQKKLEEINKVITGRLELGLHAKKTLEGN